MQAEVGVSESKISLRVISGWGVAPAILHTWLETLPPHFDIQTVDIPDLTAGQRLSVDERCEQLLQSAPDNTYWLGWSLGGAIALDLAAYSPETVRGVITLATNPCFVAQSDWPGMDREQFEAFLHSYQVNAAKTLQRFASLQIAGAQDSRAQLRELKSHLLEPLPVLSDLLELLAVDRRELVKDLRVPLVSLLATDDALVPPRVAQSLAGLGANVRAEIICQASHLLFQDQPATVTESLVDWISLQELKHAR